MGKMFGSSIPFYKMSGCGNDFIVIDNRKLKLPVAQMSKWARALCRKSFGIHADGLFFLEDPPKGSDLAYCWHFYNKDGSLGEMCGNASRCAAQLAYKIGLAPREHSFGTQAGPIRARVMEGPVAGQVRVLLPQPENVRLNLDLAVNGQQVTVHAAVIGVPHAVLLVEDLSEMDILALGHALSHHASFAPKGTNVNFAQVKDAGHILVRTYERGVYDETYACGTGAAATQLLLHKLKLTAEQAIVTTRGGENLIISLEGDDLFLQGDAKLTFKGEFFPDAMGLETGSPKFAGK